MQDNRLVTLRAVLDRIIPQDDEPSATALNVDQYVIEQLQTDASHLADDVWAGIDALAAMNFVALSPSGQNDYLILIERQRWFKNLVELAAEGFYADPDNGGNKDARSWQMIGYVHGLPEGPSGPPLIQIGLPIHGRSSM